MLSGVFRVYAYISMILAAFDIVFTWMCFRRNTQASVYLGYTSLGAAAVDITYLFSVLAEDYFTVSVMSSAYFVSIDWMLAGVVAFVACYTNQGFTDRKKKARKFLMTFAAFETVIFAINPFWEIAIGYSRTNSVYPMYTYNMKYLYALHLCFTYTLILYMLFMMVRKIHSTPRQYRNQYSVIIMGLMAVVGINAIFLYTPVSNVVPHLDYSIIGYSLVLMLMYWSCFKYTQNEMLKGLSVTIFENIGQGIVLFDYEGFLVMKNDRAVQLLKPVTFREKMPLGEFLHQCSISKDVENEDKAYSIQCYMKDDFRERAARCDYRPLRDNKGRLLGSLYVFTDAELETDLLTGFHKWENFKQFAIKNKTQRKKAAAVFDINGLGIINSSLGVDEGDRQIRLLAEAIRSCMPPETYYVRGQDAVLIAVCFDIDEPQMQEYARKVQKAYSGDLQFALGTTENHDCDSLAAIDDAMEALQIKKLLDQNSNHSQALTSLVRALQQCDSDTEAHVQRTQEMGQLLGIRIGLSDNEQSHLRLLCLLHDIGKIGIPLDILNKPSRLSGEEWNVIRSHVYKGYQIAISSDKLSGIAEMILYHHERWDGKGYPDGLSRESIPLLSRIISVVDAYDAMTNDRSYHKAISMDAAIEELRKCAGTQFDPYIVSKFIQMIREKYQGTIEEAKQTEAPKSVLPDPKKVEQDAAKVNVYPVRYSCYLLDEEDNIVEIDDAFTQITGYTPEDVRQQKMGQADLIPADERTDYLTLVSIQLNKSNVVYLEHKIRRKDGKNCFVFCYSEKYYDTALKERRTKIVISDASESYSAGLWATAESTKSQARLRYWEDLYRRDPLTGLLNHIAFQNDVEELLLQKDKKILFMMIDVDRFKIFNDTYGHAAGDELLTDLARILRDSISDSDFACRMGGDEFALALCYEIEEPDAGMAERANRIYRTVSAAMTDRLGTLNISAGVAVSDADTADFKQLYRDADQAMYASKENGRGRLTVSDKVNL